MDREFGGSVEYEVVFDLATPTPTASNKRGKTIRIQESRKEHNTTSLIFGLPIKLAPLHGSASPVPFFFLVSWLPYCFVLRHTKRACRFNVGRGFATLEK